MTRRVGALVLLVAVLAAAPGAAQQHDPPVVGAEGHAADHSGGGEHAWAPHYRNALAAVLGGTFEAEEKEALFTVGVEYERVFTRSFGVVAVLEYLPEPDAWVAALPLVYRHRSGLRLFTGPGLELKTRRPFLERLEELRHEGGGGPEHHLPEDLEERFPGRQENLFLWRFGVGYSFTVGERLAIGPALDFDLVREEGQWAEALVLAVSVGFEF